MPGDADRLHQVVANLLANARTHTPPGTTVAVRPGRRAGRARIEVVDDGPGIPADLLPHVFERFARGDAGGPAPSRGQGTGLGLSIVDAVVAAHGGSVRRCTAAPARRRSAWCCRQVLLHLGR